MELRGEWARNVCCDNLMVHMPASLHIASSSAAAWEQIIFPWCDIRLDVEDVRPIGNAHQLIRRDFERNVGEDEDVFRLPQNGATECLHRRDRRRRIGRAVELDRHWGHL